MALRREFEYWEFGKERGRDRERERERERDVVCFEE